MDQDYKKSTWVDGSEPDIDAAHLNNIEDGIDRLYKPVFDDTGTEPGITDFPSFLAKITSGMRILDFYKNLKAGLKFVLHAGQLVNNGLCNTPGKFPLDAAYGKILLDMIGNVSNLPGGAADVVAAIVKVNSDLAYKELSAGFDLNNAKGRYRTSTGSVLSSLLHKPSAIVGGEIVIDWYPARPDNTYGSQVLQHIYPGIVTIYTRGYRDGTWSAWQHYILDTDMLLIGVTDCNNATPEYQKVRMYTISWGLNMPISGDHSFVLYAYPGYSGENQNFAQMAICARSIIASNVGKIYTRSCIGGTFGAWVEK